MKPLKRPFLITYAPGLAPPRYVRGELAHALREALGAGLPLAAGRASIVLPRAGLVVVLEPVAGGWLVTRLGAAPVSPNEV